MKDSNGNRVFRSAFCLLLSAFCLLFAASCQRAAPKEDDDLGPVGAFQLTERDGRTVTQDDLRGKAWVASFVFTRCTGPCPQVSGTMARLQSELSGEKDVCFVTFTVDPEHDDPKELRRYAEHFGADPERWLFLTGSEADVYQLLREGFHVPVEQNKGKARKAGSEVMHSPRLVVVDRKGHIRGYYWGAVDPNDADPTADYEANLRRLRDKLTALAREAP